LAKLHTVMTNGESKRSALDKNAKAQALIGNAGAGRAGERVGGLEGANMEVCDWKAIPLGDGQQKSPYGLFCCYGINKWESKKWERKFIR